MTQNIHLKSAAASDLIGRQREMAILQEQFATATAGHLRVALIAGEPGIGKTRLLEGLTAHATECGATVLWGRASDAEGMPPYLPFLEALGHYIQRAALETLRTQSVAVAPILATILPELTTRLGELTGSYTLPPEQARLRLYEAVGAFLAALATPTPLVMILDDLHWADSATLDLLCHVARHQATASLMIVGAYRAEAAGQSTPLQRALAELTRLRLLTVVRTAALQPEEITALAVAYLAGPVDTAVSRLLYRQSEGNPFFAEELLRNWCETGILVQTGLRWVLAGRVDPMIPESIVAVVRQRLERLSPEVVETLRIAAILGRTFMTGLLAEILSREEEQVEEQLHEAVRIQIVRAAGDRIFTFSHDKIRECLYGEVTAARRRRVHGVIGQALEKRLPRPDAAQLAELAFHFTSSGDSAQGVLYAQRAAEQANQAYAFEAAQAHYRTALELLDPLDERSGDLLLNLGEAAVLGGDISAAVNAFAAAQGWFRQVGNRLTAARAAYGLGRALWRQENLQPARTALESALALLEDGQAPPAEIIRVLVELGSLLAVSLHEQSVGLAYAQRALALAQPLEEPRLLIAASRTVGNLLVRSNDLTGGLPLLEQALELAFQLDDPVEAAECCACLVIPYGWNGTPEKIYQFAENWLVYARRCHDPYQLRHIYSMLAIGRVFAGEWRAAEEMLEHAQATVEQLASPEPLALLGTARGLMAYFQGDYPVAEQWMAEALIAFRAMGPGALVWYLGWVEIVQAAQGKVEAARPCIAELETLLSGVPAGAMPTAEALVRLTMLALVLDDRKLLARYYAQLILFRGQFHDAFVDRLLGMIETREGNWSTARTSLAAAEAIARRINFKPELAYTLVAQADLELVQGGTGSAQRARKLLGDALTIFLELGNTTEANRVRERLRHLPTQPGARPQMPLPAGLSQREAEVLRLVATGKSNREIAATLALSEKTIANHLTTIFNKTGSDNRAAAATFAIRHGLA
jgi:DNA-binding CsgD family transcriptional regulator/tetratricopeptide (TPR) repeat protein